MNLNIVVLNLKIVVLYMSNFYECKKIYSNYKEEFINFAVNSDYVYIGGNNSLIQLNSSLGIVNVKPKRGSNWLLTPYKTENKETILISCDYKGVYKTECIGYRSNLSIVDGYYTDEVKVKKPQVRYTTTTNGPKNVVTIASSDCIKSPFHRGCFAISNYQDKFSNQNVKGNGRVSYLDETEKDKLNYNFRTVVGNGTYTYFLFVFNHTVSKLGKICKDTNTFNDDLNAYEDVPIFCSHNGVNFTTAQDLIFWNDDLLVVFTDGTASVICKFTKLYDNYAISRIERLRCPMRQLKKKHFKPEYNMCYNETIKECQSRTDVKIVSIFQD